MTEENKAWSQIKRDVVNWRYHNENARSGRGALALGIILFLLLALQGLTVLFWK